MKLNETMYDESSLSIIALLRFAVGLLGERDNGGWWPSGFMSPTSASFLAPIFASHVLPARYQGVLEAARRIHDERIGIGRVFHPFRLPEGMEQRLFITVNSFGQNLVDKISSADAALATINDIAGKPAEAKYGPTRVGPINMLDSPQWVADAASLYAASFAGDVQCFPYFAGV